jgi:predicted secreted hydrolase
MGMIWMLLVARKEGLSYISATPEENVIKIQTDLGKRKDFKMEWKYHH